MHNLTREHIDIKMPKAPKKRTFRQTGSKMPAQKITESDNGTEALKAALLAAFSSHGFDGSNFIEKTVLRIKQLQLKKKLDKQIRFSFYCTWALALWKLKIGGLLYPKMSREDAYLVSMAEFC